MSGQLQKLDVRIVPRAERHPRIFVLAKSLAPGDAFVIVNDHDPVPLRYQLQVEYPGRFSWTYLEQGPEVWRVELCRQLPA
ncbi:DUF2249 domain-containing protein [Devosia nitrariae]|uniref:Aminotransferase n=1 Tax=Devosia nitrariae TaxID=2071872 RepID=A0ABQ5WAE3_9HYPH|nr:DUF2249 domain-containing protein [Devosia nitrariae]GLQ56611.1 aminotransferase [Devosia nitrariae]